MHEYWMRFAIEEAEKALEKDEVPIGAIIVRDDEILGKGHNLTETLQDATAHAEMFAINSAAAGQAGWRLNGATLYSTVEPCPMCCGAILLSRIFNLVYAADDARFGGCGSVRNVNVMASNPFGPQIEIIKNVLNKESQVLLRTFFQRLRNGKKQPQQEAQLV